MAILNHYIDDLIVQIGKINLSAKHHWELLDLENLAFEKPTVICFSGNGALTNRQANRLAKQASVYLDLMFKTKDGNHTLENVDIMSIKYAVSDFTGAGELTKSALEQITNAIWKLLIDKDGNKLDLNTAQKNMSRLTFFTYCAGNKELQNVLRHLNQKLIYTGYTQKEVEAINQASLEVCFAPLSYPLNRLPSVQVFSMKDSFMTNYLYDGLGKVSKEQLPYLDGVYLHHEKPNQMHPSPSIQILSSSLLNSYNHAIDEHAITLMARDQNWNIRPPYIDGVAQYSFNADCVSQLMAWALCKGVENSIQNFHADQYVPHTYWHELMDDFKSIINSYDRRRLARNPVMMQNARKRKFNAIRFKNLLKFFPRLSVPTYEKMVHQLNNANSWEDAIAYLQANHFLGVEHILPDVQVLTQPEKDEILRMAGKETITSTNTFGIEI